jgi:hypothetical protein
MAQQAIIQQKTEDVYKQFYVLHGECLRLASVCSSLGFSYDKEININKVSTIEDITDNISKLVSNVKTNLHNSNCILT